ncbi:uncharacterized protein BO80DRAFT_429773 [Aspergillus ibericus CBS 121593]|uniref:Uncharacterized protein n=1 Tax=Aspergillus ibericus CBS 121593 TaxID=1448316 RepID=A0A395GJ75_9EURO|nr:hypothetical protein BO80DRAFT_429773 [Aspergillus ibericus CBS 121593]RAK95531.1 hypothetical protein BO80DRAFT_429773 [Aspergillus ibericus CBS 121593]
MATFTNQASTFQATLLSLFAGNPSDTDTDLAKIFPPTFTQRDDHTTRDFTGFVKHMQWDGQCRGDISVRGSGG